MKHETIIEKAKTLSDLEKLAMVDEILMMLDRSDPEIDALWAEEARKRRQAYRAGFIRARDYSDVIKRIRSS